MKTVPIRRVARILNGGTPTSDATHWDGEVNWATPVDLARVDGGVIASTERTLSVAGAMSGSTIAPPGAVIVSTRAPIGYSALASGPIAFNQGCKAVVPGPGLDRRFLQYSLMAMVRTLKASGSGSTFLELSTEALSTQRIAALELASQKRIADFLDDRVARIDRIIASRGDQVASLQEAVASLITTAIDAQESAVCPLWLMLAHITDGAHVSPETNGGVFDFVSTRDVDMSGAIDFRGSLKTTVENYEMLVRQDCQPKKGDVLFSKDGTVGRTARVLRSRDFVVASSLIILRAAADRLDADYLHYMFKHASVAQSVNSFVKGAGLPRISVSNLKRVVGRFPPITVQRQLAREFDEFVTSVAQNHLSLRLSADLLAEYRASLITAAVTGELDVTTAGSGIPG